MAKENLSWRSFVDQGAIAAKWKPAGTPTFYVIDHQGVIRYKWAGAPGEKVMAAALEKVIEQAEGAGKTHGRSKRPPAKLELVGAGHQPDHRLLVVRVAADVGPHEQPRLDLLRGVGPQNPVVDEQHGSEFARGQERGRQEGTQEAGGNGHGSPRCS